MVIPAPVLQECVIVRLKGSTRSLRRDGWLAVISVSGILVALSQRSPSLSWNDRQKERVPDLFLFSFENLSEGWSSGLDTIKVRSSKGRVNLSDRWGDRC